MAEETLKELSYNGSKILVEAAKRDAQGRTINTTYATIANTYTKAEVDDRINDIPVGPQGPEGPQGPRGPQGPKGESYGTFTKTAKNGDELGPILSGLTATQSVVGAYATIGNKTVELIVISYTKAEMIYAWSTFADNPDEPTTATWQAVTSQEASRFPVGDVYADSITLYIYDSSKSLMDKVSFIKLDDDGILPQYQIPRFNNPSEIAKDSATLKGKFGTGSFNLINGLVLDCFLVIGTTVCVGKFNGDGENEIYIDNITPLENGAIVSMADGNGHYKNYQVLENTTEKWLTGMWEMLYPMNCRFDLEVKLPGDILLNSMDNVNVKIKMVSDSTQRSLIQAKGMHNSSMYVDASEYHPVNEEGAEAFQMYLQGENYGAFTEINMERENSATTTDAISKIAVGSSTAVGLEGNSFPRIARYSALNINDVGSGKLTNYWFVTFDKAVYSSAGKAVRMDYRFEFSPSGMATLQPVPFVIDYTPATATTMAKAKAMSVQAKPVELNVPDDAIGIFSVDSEGNTINAMTGERI